MAVTASLLIWAPSAEAQPFNNAAIADAGLKEVGTRRPTGWNQPGECIKSVQRWVAAAGGRLNGGGPVSGYTTAGAKEVSLAAAVKGDIIQYTSIARPNTDWTYPHTVVVVQNFGNGRYDIVQSNVPAGSGLVSRNTNWTPRPHAGWLARVWRVGTVMTGGAIANGTFVRTPDGRVWRIAGGAPLYISSWAPFGGPQPVVNVSNLAGFRQFPADGTFIAAADTGRVYRVAGGAPLYINTWGPFGGPQPLVAITQWSIDNGSFGHLRQFPADGTILQGLPSSSFWRIMSGCRTGSAPDTKATGVTDYTIQTLRSCA
jgi:hypothetical protein